MNRHRPRRALRSLSCAALAAVLAGWAVPAHAQRDPAPRRGFFLRVALPTGSLGATMQKTVDNTAPNTLVPEPRRGKVYHDEASGSALTFGIGGAVGYRVPLAGDSWFLEGDLGVALNRGRTNGQFTGVGSSPDRRQLGESWPDSWTYAKRVEYGVSVRLGGSPEGLRARGGGVYALAGAHFADMRFTNHYRGCFSPEPCREYAAGTEHRDLDSFIWVAGAGIERRLGQRSSFRVEARYRGHALEEWTTPFEDVGVTVRSSMAARELGMTIGLVRWF